MRNTLMTILCLLLFAASTYAGPVTPVEVKTTDAVTKVTFYSPEIVRVVKVPAGNPGNTRESLVVTMDPQNVNATLWSYGLVFCLYYEFLLLWQMPWAWLTFWVNDWGTRGKGKKHQTTVAPVTSPAKEAT